MKLIWSYLKSKHRWLLLDCFGGFLFVVVNLGMPTILARMIDEGIKRKYQDFYAEYSYGYSEVK